MFSICHTFILNIAYHTDNVEFFLLYTGMFIPVCQEHGD